MKTLKKIKVSQSLFTEKTEHSLLMFTSRLDVAILHQLCCIISVTLVLLISY